MKLHNTIIAFLFSLLTLSAAAVADSQVEETHNELRALRDGLMDAMNKGDIERQLAYLHTNVVITWHNAEVSRGRDGVRQYYEKMTTGPQKMLESFTAEIVVDELTVLHGEAMGVAYGSSMEHFKLTQGSAFDLVGRWSATLVKEDGKWLVASLHASTNVFDNAILSIIKNNAFRAVCAVFAFALVLGGLLGWFMGRKRKTA